jgi:hypothetical protein
VRLIRFNSMREIYAKQAKASEAGLPADERRGVYILGDDPAELRPVLRGAADGGTVTCTHSWSRWEQLCWCSRWLALGLLLGAITAQVVRWII